MRLARFSSPLFFRLSVVRQRCSAYLEFAAAQTYTLLAHSTSGRKSMAIIVSKNGHEARKVERSTFDKEDDLQRYLRDNPEALPVDQIRDGASLVVLAREYPTESGPIDILAADDQGRLCIIETKRYCNPDKRTVVAQVLDYGAALWRHSYERERHAGAPPTLRNGLGGSVTEVITPHLHNPQSVRVPASTFLPQPILDLQCALVSETTPHPLLTHHILSVVIEPAPRAAKRWHPQFCQTLQYDVVESHMGHIIDAMESGQSAFTESDHVFDAHVDPLL
jgi:hypothetical protein